MGYVTNTNVSSVKGIPAVKTEGLFAYTLPHNRFHKIWTRYQEAFTEEMHCLRNKDHQNVRLLPPKVAPQGRAEDAHFN